jgi:hypothetical protein
VGAKPVGSAATFKTSSCIQLVVITPRGSAPRR